MTATTPATTPSTTTTTTVPAATTGATTSTTAVSSITIDRLAEVEAIFYDLERRRLQAIYEGDIEATRELFAHEAFWEANLPAMDPESFLAEPTDLTLTVKDLLVDRDDCLAALVYFQADRALGPEAASEATVVLQPTASGWGFSFFGTGWLCDGEHPFGDGGA